MDSIDFGLYFLYLMAGAAITIAVVLPIINLFSNPKALIRIGIGAAVFLLIFFLAFSLSDATLSTKWISQGQTGDGIKMIGAGLWMLYLFLFGSLLAMIYSEVSKLLK